MKNTVIHLSQDCPRTGHVPGRGQDEDKRGQKKFHCQKKTIDFLLYKITTSCGKPPHQFLIG